MSLMPWNPPLEMPSEPAPPPKGAGFFGSLRHLWKAFRLSFFGWVLMFIGFAMVPLIIKIMAGIGIGFVSYQLGSWALNEVFEMVKQYLSLIPPEAIAFAAMCKIDEAISILFAGLAVRLSLMGFTAATANTGKVKEMIWQA